LLDIVEAASAVVRAAKDSSSAVKVLFPLEVLPLLGGRAAAGALGEPPTFTASAAPAGVGFTETDAAGAVPSATFAATAGPLPVLMETEASGALGGERATETEAAGGVLAATAAATIGPLPVLMETVAGVVDALTWIKSLPVVDAERGATPAETETTGTGLAAVTDSLTAIVASLATGTAMLTFMTAAGTVAVGNAKVGIVALGAAKETTASS
jgi:hypothetical protein